VPRASLRHAARSTWRIAAFTSCTAAAVHESSVTPNPTSSAATGEIDHPEHGRMQGIDTRGDVLVFPFVRCRKTTASSRSILDRSATPLR
jgi:hypothetical protein